MSEPLTLAEAVPLGTAHLQRLLADAGVRSLVIKGPAFVELGVRQPKQSNDIDLLVARHDQEAAVDALASGGWTSQSSWYPRALDDVTFSRTFSHTHFPVTVDLHHHFSGLLEAGAFEVLWKGQTTVQLANCPVVAPARVDALLIEALNALKSHQPAMWRHTAERVVSNAAPVELDAVVRAAIDLGARETAAPLIEAMGGAAPDGPSSRQYARWVRESGRERPRLLVRHLILRAPWALPRVVWDRLTPKGVRAASGIRSNAGGVSTYVRLLVRRIWRVLAR
ncbi:nucleotidyltransferase family protein [Janibacter anophelis]|uniref:nucleotidyltransferase family protein n=1 Tax=Janibacter anophelis TaxID=319054 RepID=UPI000831CE42|nr:nucleotidyltransferase family protein [Janibacter anophelis]